MANRKTRANSDILCEAQNQAFLRPLYPFPLETRLLYRDETQYPLLNTHPAPFLRYRSLSPFSLNPVHVDYRIPDQTPAFDILTRASFPTGRRQGHSQIAHLPSILYPIAFPTDFEISPLIC